MSTSRISERIKGLAVHHRPHTRGGEPVVRAMSKVHSRVLPTCVGENSLPSCSGKVRHRLHCPRERGVGEQDFDFLPDLRYTAGR